jgi:uncharacterized membrane protein YfcA
MFSAQHFAADRIMHLALGTSLASIVLTSVASVRAHHQHRAVLWDIVRNTAPGVAIGALLGTLFADALPSRFLAIFFVAFVYASAAQLWLNRKPKPTRQLPGAAGLALVGAAVGALSSLVGVGGGVLMLPLMTTCNVPMRNVIGTSAALALPISVAGALGYALTGLNKTHLPALSIGYVYVPALIGIVVGTFLTVPSGAKLAHRLPVLTLKRLFAVMLLVLGTRMLLRLL